MSGTPEKNKTNKTATTGNKQQAEIFLAVGLYCLFRIRVINIIL